MSRKLHIRDISRVDRIALWDAIDAYVRACGGDPSKHVYGNTPRQEAVARVERVVADEIGKWVTK